MVSRASIADKLAPFVQASGRESPQEADPGPAPRGQRPFVTILRDAGAGGSTLAHALAAALNERESGERWQAFDRELVEKVAEDYHISEPLVESIGESSRNWLDKLLITGPESEFGVYKRVATTLRALAEIGGAILVGRGGVFITRDLPGGVHVRLVAPRADRIRRLGEKRALPDAEAERQVREIEAARAVFYRNRWPGHTLDPENFHATFNTARVDTADVVAAMLALVPRLDAPARQSPARRA